MRRFLINLLLVTKIYILEDWYKQYYWCEKNRLLQQSVKGQGRDFYPKIYLSTVSL